MLAAKMVQQPEAVETMDREVTAGIQQAVAPPLVHVNVLFHQRG